jgi:hypothetical protein
MELIQKNGRFGVEVDGIFVPAISGGSDFTVVSPGANNNSSPDATARLELFYKKFAGEVMTTFSENNIMLPKTMVRTISSGKSAAFPATGVAAAAYHVPGTELVGQTILGSERVISIDSLVTADVFIANIDEAMSEFEVRSIYSGECGIALADKIDINLLRILVLASRASSTVTNGNGGTVITDADGKTNGASLAASVYAVAQAWDEKKVPMQDRNGYFLPAQYYLLAQNTDLINKDWTGGNGDLSKGTIGSIGGIQVNKTNHVAVTNSTAVTGEVNSYAVSNANNEVASFGQKRAIGTVKLLDLAVESEYSVRHQGTLLVAKYAMGHGILRPECAASIKTA